MDQRATLTRRSFAFLLDNVLLILTLCVGYYVWLFFTARRATTPGKRMLGLRIHAAASGSPASARRVWLREGGGKALLPVALSVLVDLITTTAAGDAVFAVYWIAGILSPFLTSDRRAMWDYLSGTVVVREDALATLPASDDYKRFEDALPSRRTPIR